MKKYWYFIPMMAFAIGIMVGCGSSTSGSGGTGTGVPAGGACKAGYIYSTQYGCMLQCPSQPGYGQIPNSNPPQCVLANPGGGYGYYSYAGSMNIVNMYQFQQYLAGMGICNQWSGWNFGTADCASWGSGYLQVSFNGSVNAVYGMVNTLAFLNGSYGQGGAGVGFNGTFQPTNANMSYTLQTYGPPGSPAYNSIIQVIATASNPAYPINFATDNQITVNLYYQGTQFASVSAQRTY